MKLYRTKNFADFSAQINGKIYANKTMHLENCALVEAENFSKCEGLSHLSFTPDFHKGSGVPIGTVAVMDRIYPNVIGNDIGCGMSLYATNLFDVDVTPELKDTLRGVYFEGKRDVHVKSRSDLLEYGFLRENLYGDTMQNVPFKGHMNGQLGFGGVHSIFDQYLSNKSSRENFLGSIGGGNHFVEVQRVDSVKNPKLAYDFGLKKNQIVIMIHSGSLDLGQLTGKFFRQKARDNWVGKHPENGMFYLSDDLAQDYMLASRNAANFAINNRFVMANMIANVLGTELQVIYDSPHNLVWETSDGYLYRKGSCPAADNEPVIIPGSMGTKSSLCVGKGFSGTKGSSPHGAGRVMKRNAARNEDIKDIDVVTKISLDNARGDVKKEVMKNLAEEAPRSYKDLGEVISSVESNGIADLVCWLSPIMTMKG